MPNTLNAFIEEKVDDLSYRLAFPAEQPTDDQWARVPVPDVYAFLRTALRECAEQTWAETERIQHLWDTQQIDAGQKMAGKRAWLGTNDHAVSIYVPCTKHGVQSCLLCGPGGPTPPIDTVP